MTKRSAPPLSVVVNKTTNRLAGFGYDSKGNLTQTPLFGMTIAYDGQNRVTRVTTASGTEYYGYAGDNRRVWKGWAIQGWEQVAPVAPEESGYPYGEGKSQGYATYETDGTGLDYAWNRYCQSTYGRFTSADRYVSRTAVVSPQGWNRYGYVEGDPVNATDPQGLQLQR